MLKMHAMLDSCSLSRMAGEGWGEGAFKARGAEAALIHPSGTFSRLREKGLSSSTFSTSRDAC